eukprot:gene17320-20614_t
MKSALKMESASKWPAAACIAGLVADGTIESFDTPVNKHLEYWATDPADPRSAITLRHLLSFQSGYLSGAGSVPCASVKLDDFDFCTRQLYSAAKYGKDMVPGTVWDYNSIHLQFAGAMATAASGLSIEEVLDKYLIKRLGMTDTTWGGQNPQVATGMVTTGDDFEKFLQALLVYDKGFLPKEIVDQMEVDYSKAPVHPSGDGWFGHYGQPLTLLQLGGMGHWIECLGYGTPDERAPLSSDCLKENIHAGPGLYGYYPLIDRSRQYYLQESYAKSGIPEYLRIVSKPLADAIVSGMDPSTVNRRMLDPA